MTETTPTAAPPRVRIGFTETVLREHRVDLGDWSAGEAWPSPPCGAHIMTVVPEAFDPDSGFACAHCARADRRAP